MYKFTDKSHISVTNLDTGYSGIHSGLGMWAQYQEWLAEGGITEAFDTRTEEQKLSAIKSDMRQKIKIEAMLRISGGVLVGGLWFHSNPESRMEYIMLREAARDQLAAGGALGNDLMVDGEVVKITLMDETETTITCRKAINIIEDIQKLDQRLRKKRKAHIDAMLISPDPENYNYSTNWPARFGDAI